MRYRYKKSILYAHPTPTTGAFGSVTSRWGQEKYPEKAVLSPPSGALAAARYGLELGDMVTMTLRKGCPIAANDGVWLENTEAPWGIVAAVRAYPRHTEADVKRAVVRHAH